MGTFQKWVKNCFDSIVDPDKEVEVTELVKLLHEGIAKHKQSFVLAEVLKDRPYKQRHLDQARSELYRKFLRRSWADGEVNASELATLNWTAKCLELPPAEQRTLTLETVRPRFAEALAAAMDDGQITAEEAAHLESIAKAAGLPLNQFVQEFFRSEGEAFLRGIFAAAVFEGRSAVDALDRMVAAAAKLGISRANVLFVVQPQAIRYIEHFLADAKQDDSLTADEEKTLAELLRKFELPPNVRDYIVGEIKELRLLTEVRGGKLPSLTMPRGISLKAGELVHYHGRCVWEFLRILKSGDKVEEHAGMLTIADSRLIFSSDTRGESFSYAKIVGYDCPHGTIQVQLQGKPIQRFFYRDRSHVPGAILESALRMANQTLINRDTSRNARHIPREIRQRVWQRYSGQCAECSATTYLEFDHIIPVAKGGSSSESNVQLLCRNCNLKKSDRI